MVRLSLQPSLPPQLSTRQSDMDHAQKAIEQTMWTDTPAQ